MIIPNGFVEFISVQGGGIDEVTGFAKAASVEYGRRIPCQYVEGRINMIAKNDGEPVAQRSYTVLLDPVETPLTERLRLSDASGQVIGEYPVINAIPLVAVNQVKITI